MIDESLDKQILQYLTNGTGKLIQQRCNKYSLNKRGWLDYVLQRYDDLYSTEEIGKLKEAIYRLNNNIEKRPICKTCGRLLRWTNYRYPIFCSTHCANTDPDVLKKNKEGVSKSLKKTYSERGDSIKEKRKQTLIATTGDENATCSPFSCKVYQEKMKTTITERYGVPNILMIEEMHKRSAEAMRRKSEKLWASRGMEIQYTGNDTIIVKDACPIHGDVEISTGGFNIRTKEGPICKRKYCLICNPWNSFSGLELILKEILDTFDVTYTTQSRKIIYPLELDFVLEDYNYAIETNGIYFHSVTPDKPNEYHKIKSDACNEKGYTLFHIWEDDMKKKKEVVISKFKKLFNKENNIIQADECICSKISNKIAKDFIVSNEVLTNTKFNISFGLFRKEELVEVMTFAKNEDGTLCLSFIVEKINTLIQNGHKKLFSFAQDTLSSKYKISNALVSRDFPIIQPYLELGFIFSHYIEPVLVKRTLRDGRENDRKYKCFNSGFISLSLPPTIHI